MRNWEQIYQTLGNGDMPECLGKDCPASCCRIKEKDTGYQKIFYRTTLVMGEELVLGKLQDWPKELDPSLAIKPLNITFTSCTTENNPICKLQGQKPFACRIYPFDLYPRRAISTECPVAREIAGNQATIRRVLATREIEGLTDHDVWLKSLNEILGKR